MSNAASLGSSVSYSGSTGSAGWQGRVVDHGSNFAEYMREVVEPRVADTASSFASDLRGLATTGMETEFVERVLNAVPALKGWEIGEALAECALGNDAGREVHWPWNTVRDRRTPRASLPGADLVGFCREDDTVLLLFGEVKTSSDTKTPPGVMNGGSGMTWQLEQSATRLDVQHALLKWLHARCYDPPYHDLYENERWLATSSPKEKIVMLVGVLLRDTTPSERDLKARGKTLAEKLPAPTRINLVAWYLPQPIADWSKLLQGGCIMTTDSWIIQSLGVDKVRDSVGGGSPTSDCTTGTRY